jgi:4-amino-4-deoxy-L-arabinose transferase-like glycosyltransferase
MDGYLFVSALACTAVLALVAAIGFRLGGMWTAVAAIALIALSSQIVFLGTIATVDIPYAALVLVCAWLAALGPRRNAVPIMVLLALAGTMRPDAWGLAAIYALGLLLTRPGKRTVLMVVCLAAIAPLSWMAMDLALTGDPIDTLHQQERGSVAGKALTDLYPIAERGVGVEHRRLGWLPGGERLESILDAMRFLIGLPLFFLGGLMLLRAVATLRRRGPPAPGSREAFALSLSAVVLAAMAVELIPSIAGLPVQPRYMLPAGLALILLAASALPLARRSLAVAVTAAIVAGLVALQIPYQMDTVSANTAIARTQRREEGELTRLIDVPRVKRDLTRCPTLLASGRPQSFQASMARVIVADRLGRDPDSIAGVYPPRLAPQSSIFVLDQGATADQLQGHEGEATISEGAWRFSSTC